MDIFEQKRYFIITIVLLGILNILTLGIVLWKEYNPIRNIAEPQSEMRDVSEILKKELNLTEMQVESIKNIRLAFFAKEKVLSQKIRGSRDSMNVEMFNDNTNNDVLQSLARRVADNEYQMELLRIEQAEQLKAICTPEQRKKFEKLVKEIRDYFKPEKPQKNQVFRTKISQP